MIMHHPFGVSYPISVMTTMWHTMVKFMNRNEHCSFSTYWVPMHAFVYEVEKLLVSQAKLSRFLSIIYSGNWTIACSMFRFLKWSNITSKVISFVHVLTVKERVSTFHAWLRMFSFVSLLCNHDYFIQNFVIWSFRANLWSIRNEVLEYIYLFM